MSKPPSPLRSPQSMAKPKPRLQCHCEVCQGKLVSSSTWYSHNPGGRKRLCAPLPQEIVDVILKQPETGLNPLIRKRRFDGDEDEVHTSKRAAGSSSVCIISCPHGICALKGLYSRSCAPSVFVLVWKTLAGMRRTQKRPGPLALSLHLSLSMRKPPHPLLLRY